jgi:hypothetical protein
MTDAGSFGYGQFDPSDAASDWSVHEFQVAQILSRVRTMQIVRVLSITGGGIAAPPIVSVQVLVNQIDGKGNATEHGPINNVPVFRLQGANGSVVCDPAVNDVGWMAVADRDISAVKSTAGKRSNPGSRRRFDLADGVYMGGLFGGAPTQYVSMTATGIKLSDRSGNAIEMKAGSIDVTTLAFRVNGAVVAGFGTGDQVNLQTHNHPTAATGPPSSPTPGT